MHNTIAPGNASADVISRLACRTDGPARAASIYHVPTLHQGDPQISFLEPRLTVALASALPPFRQASYKGPRLDSTRYFTISQQPPNGGSEHRCPAATAAAVQFFTPSVRSSAAPYSSFQTHATGSTFPLLPLASPPPSLPPFPP